MKDLKERTLRAGLAKTFAQGVNFIIRVGSLMVIARLLDPEDFGLVGMVTVFTGVFSMFIDAGLSTVTVQRASITNEQVSTLFWTNMFVGAILWLLTFGAAPILVSFYREPRLFWMTAALATGFLINAAGVQHSALLQRGMRFGALSVAEIFTQVVSSAVGIGMALGGFGYWALVGMAIMGQATYTVCVWLTMDWVPGLPRRGVGGGSMIRFGGMATLNTFVVYVAYNLEKVLLGRFWGAEALGIYGRAYQLINLPTENLNSAIGGVALSVLSRLQGDASRFKSYFLKFYSLIISLTLPITIACALFADDIILLLLGPKWTDAVPIFRLLAPTILTFALVNPFSSFLMSLGMVGRLLKIALVLAPVMIAAYVLGLPYGPRGVAFAYSAVMTMSAVPLIAWCIHGTMISSRDFLDAVSRPFLSAIVAAALAFGVQAFYGQSLSPFPRLILGGGILMLSYLWMLLYVMGQKAFYFDLLQGLWQRSSVGEKASATI
jgi:O-antigen/teichoic acid export membrane protein